MGATREVRCYTCPNQQQFDLDLPTGAIIKGLIVRQHVELVCIVDPEVLTTTTRTIQAVNEGAPFAPANLTWIGMVDYRGRYRFVGEVILK